MTLAQRLYEGIELGDEGPVGLITYMRTDSTRIADEALAEVRAYISDRFGAEFLPEEPAVYKSAKLAQGAHEAIRPTSMKYDPETVRRLLEQGPRRKPRSRAKTAPPSPRGPGRGVDHERDVDDLVKLYALIWNRFVASQMKPAVYDQTTVDIDRGAAQLRANGQVMKFAGYTKVYEVAETDDAKAEAAEVAQASWAPAKVSSNRAAPSAPAEACICQAARPRPMNVSRCRLISSATTDCISGCEVS